MFGRPARFLSHEVDLSVTDAAADAIAAVAPKVVVQAASFQAGSVISNQGNAWTRLVAEGGLSATAVLQAPLSVAVARAVKAARPQAHFINCCFADVVNPLIAALGLPITCGVGNVAILANAFAGALGLGPGRLKVLAHYQNLAPFRRLPTRVAAGAACVHRWCGESPTSTGTLPTSAHPRARDRDLGRERRAADARDGGGTRLERHVPGTARLARRLSGPARGGRNRA